ncbi:hypothetical protein KSP40_PGU021381 [Platanthera guangdongensis]|uniref:Uncharacterized protein n=1 Tax=Platanthera guangdongensis TaxID=2320717 RepID=A0ABR2MXW7_9ASPA
MQRITLVSANKTLIPSYLLSSYLRSKLSFFPSSSPPLRSNTNFQKSLVSASSPSGAATSANSIHLRHHNEESPQSLSNWGDFTARVSGEWDGFGAEFSAEGKPIELPEFVVPNAFREWEVEIFDWQTQCPTLASQTIEPLFFYKLVKLLPAVGCEADAATRYSVDERIAGGSENNAAAFGFHPSGRYICVWPVDGFGGKRMLELEHCLVNPKNWEERMRVIQVVRIEEGMVSLEKIWGFSEHWDGPFRNGVQLGGCAIKETGFALTDPVEDSEIVGEWEGRERFSIGGLAAEQKFSIHQLAKGQSQKSIRGQIGLTALPKNLWCYLKTNNNGETLAEVGWLVDRGHAMTSKCVLHSDGRIKVSFSVSVLP